MQTGTEPKVGDYHRHSWGYDQTNIDMCVIVEVSPTGKTALCRMVRTIHLGETGAEEIVTPGEAYGDPFRLQIRGDCLKGSYPLFAKYENSPLRNRKVRGGCFDRVNLGDELHRTLDNFGH